MIIKQEELYPFYIEVDTEGYVIHKISVKGDTSKTPGAVSEKAISWFTTLEGACAAIVREKLALNQDVVTLNEFIEKLEKLFNNLVKEIKNAIK